MLDQVDDGVQGYKYHHKFRFLEKEYELLAKERIPDEPRSLIIYQLKK
jgi:hypothetical protein